MQKLYKLKQEQGVESEPLFPSSSRSRHLPATGKSWPICPHSPKTLSRRRPCSAQPCSLEPEDPAPHSHLGLRGGPEEPEAEGATPVEGEGDGEAVLMEEDLIQHRAWTTTTPASTARLLTAHELPLDAHVLEPTRTCSACSCRGSSFRSQVCRGVGQEVGLSCLWGGQGQSFLAEKEALSLNPLGSSSSSSPECPLFTWSLICPKDRTVVFTSSARLCSELLTWPWPGPGAS